MPLIYQEFITRADLRSNPERLYVFGDNVQKTGFGGQAKEMRGEPNAVGIPTKWFPKLTPKAFFWDSQSELIEPLLEPNYQQIIDHLEGQRTVVWPSANIGTGLSRLTVYAPILWAKMEQVRTAVLEQL